MKEKIKILYVLITVGLVVIVFYYHQKWQDTEQSLSNCAEAPLEKTIAFHYCFDLHLGLDNLISKTESPEELYEMASKIKNWEETKAKRIDDFHNCFEEAQKDPIGTLKKIGFEEINPE